MRHIATFNNEKKAVEFSAYLNGHSVLHRIEAAYVRDWSSDDYGTWRLEFWALNEEQQSKAVECFSLFQQGERKAPLRANPSPIEVIAEPDAIEGESLSLEQRKRYDQEAKQVKEVKLIKETQQLNQRQTITHWLVFFCIFCFAVSYLTQPSLPQQLPNLPVMPFITPPIKQMMLYDWPQPYGYVDELRETYGDRPLLAPHLLSPAGQKLFFLANHTPIWQGVYPVIVNLAKSSLFKDKLSKSENDDITTDGLFYKIGQGQIWRLITPIFLHGDLFHILFNMLWLLLLGKQLEGRLGVGRYLVFIAITAIFSNSVQYLMSGPNFLGFSGVLCAMIAFIWQRQRLTPWEGYPLPQETIRFVAFFVLVLFGLQLFSFAAEVAGLREGFIPIANSAHLSGALCGWLLACTPLFAMRS